MMSEPKIFRLRLSSWHVEITVPEKGTDAKWTLHAMPNYIGAGGDRLLLSEILQTIAFLETVSDFWAKQKSVQKGENII
jgi:hypothetical protein